MKGEISKTKILDLDKWSINITLLIMALNAIGVFIYNEWMISANITELQKSSTYIPIFVDCYLGFNLFKRHSWAKDWIIGRVILGGIYFIALSLYQKDYSGSAMQLIIAIALIALLVKRVNRIVAKVLGIIAILLISYVGVQNISSIIRQGKIISQVVMGDSGAFLSEKFGYQISVPNGWKIIKRENFDKIGQALVNTEAEVAIMNTAGTGVCLVIPEVLQGYGSDFGLKQVRDYLVNQIKGSDETHFVSGNLVYSYGDGGVELHYFQMEGSFKRDYMKLYILYGKTAISLLAFAFEQNSQKVFNEVKSIVSKIELVK